VELYDAIKKRRMARRYQRRAIPDEVLSRVLDAARRVPSAGFSQGFELLVLDKPVQTERFWRATFPDPNVRAGFGFQGLFDAPVIVVPYAHAQAYLERYREPDKSYARRARRADWVVPYWIVDTSFAAMNLLLAATAEGLGALFFAVDEYATAVSDAFGVPSGFEPIGAITLGWPLEEPLAGSAATRTRRALDELVHRNHW